VLAQRCELVLVIGSKESSNTNRLCEVAVQHGTAARRIDTCDEIDPAALQDVTTVGVTSGASAPDFLVQEVLAWLKQHGARSVEPLDVVNEDIAVFSLPQRIHDIAQEKGKTLQRAR